MHLILLHLCQRLAQFIDTGVDRHGENPKGVAGSLSLCRPQRAAQRSDDHGRCNPSVYRLIELIKLSCGRDGSTGDLNQGLQNSYQQLGSTGPVVETVVERDGSTGRSKTAAEGKRAPGIGALEGLNLGRPQKA